ncbi:unnamed protein product [Oppiella nova]|uniref:Uncharacterized protein n=1 Tax=Oppiella nova TaxID=334625 RepID=A0A7R9QRI0_9ACAR|nr:unnamed protein product [Oppiella nova]CAG2171674.1 unnamed protein product [Oppiella nova]
MSNRRQWISKAEDVAGEVKLFLRHVYLTNKITNMSMSYRQSRAGVWSPYEDGLHMLFRWSQERDLLDSRWNCGYGLAILCVSINMLSQLTASGLVLIRYHVIIGCGLLFGTVWLQL